MFHRLRYGWKGLLHVLTHSPRFHLITQLRGCSFDTAACEQTVCGKSTYLLFFPEGQSGEESTSPKAVQKAVLFLAGVRRGALSRDKEVWKQWNYQEGGGTSPRIWYTVVVSLRKDQCKGKKHCWVDHEREKSVFLALQTKKKKRWCGHMSIFCKDIKIHQGASNDHSRDWNRLSLKEGSLNTPLKRDLDGLWQHWYHTIKFPDTGPVCVHTPARDSPAQRVFLCIIHIFKYNIKYTIQIFKYYKIWNILNLY